MTTREKILRLVGELQTMDTSDASEELGPLLEFAQISKGLGFDLFGALVPGTDAEADMLVDQLITVLLEVRGDDLPPYDRERVIVDAGG